MATSDTTTTTLPIPTKDTPETSLRPSENADFSTNQDQPR